MDRNEPGSADSPIDGNAVSRDEGPLSWPMHPDELSVRSALLLNLSTPLPQPATHARRLLRGFARPPKYRERVTC
jgi:hypothetical protein